MSEIFWIGEGSLDVDQAKAVQGVGLDESFLLRGPAGSGKTNILLLRAKWFTFKAKSHLQIIVFTKSLRDFVKSGCAQYKISEHTVVTGMQFIRTLLEENGVDYELTGEFESDRAMLAGKAKALIDTKKIENTFDALLVDEAQDYTDTELYVFRRLAQRLVLAADSRQSIYKTTHSSNYLEELVDNRVIALKYHYRSGLSICNVADAILRDPVNYPPLSAECLYDEKNRPSSILPFPCASFDEQVEKILSHLPDQLRLYPKQQIGILFPKNSQKQAFIEVLERSGMEEVGRVWVDTLHGSKGWEFVAIHIGGCEALPKMGPTQKRLIYTGILRARTSVSLYYTEYVPGYLSSAVAKIAPPPHDPGLGSLFGE